jgi:hypothetical protein
MVTHYASNLLTGSTMLRAFTGNEREMYYILFTGFTCLAALIILIASRFKLGAQE